MFKLFRKKEIKKEIKKDEDNNDICSQLGYTGKCLIAETLRQGVMIIENYESDKYSVEKAELICNILGDIFECEKVNYMDILHMLYGRKKENNGTDECSKSDEEYLRLFLRLTHEYVGYDDCIKLKLC